MFISTDISRLTDDGRFLYIDMRPRLDVFLKYTCWADGLVLYRNNGKGWEIENDDPNLPLLTPEHDADSRLPVHAFIQSIPADIRAAASRFDHLQTKILQLLAAGGAALDLLHDIPLLLWLVADWAQGPEVSISDIKLLLRKKRAVILSQMLGRQCSEIDVRFLKKIPPPGFNDWRFHLIKHYIYDGRAGDFRHWREVPYYILVILKNHRELVACRFIRLMADEAYKPLVAIASTRSAIINLINDSVLLGRKLGVTHPMRFINRCETIVDLQTLHNQWVRKYNARKNDGEMLIRSMIAFPEPPIPGNLKIQPIRNEGELLMEGRLMHHCVGGYTSKIHKGQSYIYRVLEPERATLEIRGSGMSVHIGQLKLARNHAPSEETRIEVFQWMEAFRKTCGGRLSADEQNKRHHQAERSARCIASIHVRHYADRPNDDDMLPQFSPPRTRA